MPWPLRMVSYAATVLFILFLYFGVRYFRSIELLSQDHTGTFKMIYGLAALLFFAYPVWGLFSYWFKGSYNHTALPAPVIYLFWFGLIFSGIMLNWTLMHDLLLPLLKKLSSFSPEWLNLQFARIFLTLTVVTFIFSATKLAWDTYRITTTKLEHKIATDITGFTPLRVIHIADLHADRFTDEEKMNRYVDHINALYPDLVLFGGDLISSGTDYVKAGAAALGKIQSTYGTFAVLGDHDYWNQPEFIIETLAGHGIEVLRDKNIHLDHNGHSIRITGITELYSRMISPGSLKTLLNEPSDGVIKILLTHQATDHIINKSKEHGIDLLLGAHTHGGQIRIPIFFHKVTAARSETRYVNGQWTKDQMMLNVNNGLGFTLSPVRYNAPAEVTLITLKSG